MDETLQIKQELLKVTSALVSNCKYCTTISDDPDLKTPIYCTKLSGSFTPICVNVATCLSCGEYKLGWHKLSG
jgi:hypothetical protein